MENNQEPVTQTVEKTEVSGEQPVEKNEQSEVKSFTQEEVNAILAKERKKMPSKEDLKEFNEWRESKKTEADKQMERAQEFAKIKNEKDQLKQLMKIYDAGVVGKDNVEFIQFKISKMDGDFDENLETYLKNNPKYLQKEIDDNEPKTTGTSVKKISDNADDGVTAILKAKHPDINF